MKVAIIPARGGSTRIPRKNIRLFHGKPIIQYSIELAQNEPQLFDHVIVSSDDKEILDFAVAHGAVALERPPLLAQDQVGTQAVGHHAVMWADQHLTTPDLLTHACVIYATAPMIERADLWRGWEQVRNGHRAFAFSVGDNPLRDAGQFYWGTAKAFRAHRPLIGAHSAMIPIEDARICDINTEEDWERALRMYRALHPERETIFSGATGP